jgi:hypothetical protein
MKQPNVPQEALDVANMYTLLSIGLTYDDIQNIPASLADSLLAFHFALREKQAQANDSDPEWYKKLKNG